MLFQPPELDSQEEAVIARIDEVRTALSYAVASRRWTGVLARMTVARNIQGSNSIEGYNVTIDDALAAEANEEPLEAEGETWDALTGYRNAMTYILQLSDDPHFAFSRGLIRSLHYMMLQYDFTKHPGKWRPGPIFVRNDQTGERVYEGPDAELVNGLAHELVEYLNHPPTGVHPLVLAAMSHLDLVMIHPFADGNGRMGRALQTLVLARTGILSREFCSIEEYLGRNREEYYRVLSEVGAGSWHPERDARPWVRFCLKAQFRQASTLMRRARVFQRVWDALEHETKQRGLPDRTIGILGEAALGLKARNATYRKHEDISENLASRDLKMLTDVGLLVPKGEKRGRYYIAAPILSAIGREATARENKVIADPFDLNGYLPGLAPLP
ncbi:MAG: Fic family protein [Vicinamibacteria bacterium]|nr:Fic family protein [Vicinamibacteria bacterium]